MELKKCKKCGDSKPFENFYRSGNGNRRGTCSFCYRDHRKLSDYKPESRFKKYRRDAKKRGLFFGLTRQQFFSFEGKPCRYCGVKVLPISLDRINNDEGYLIDNVDSCCSLCNSLKHVLGEADFLKHVRNICNYQTGKTNGKQESLSEEISKEHITNSKRS